MLSVVIPSRTWEEGERAVGRLPPGAGEILLVVGDGVHPGWMRNLGAKEAKGEILAFVDDDVQLTGDFGWFEREAAPTESWWTAAQFSDSTGDPGSATMAAWWTAAGHMGVWSGTVGCFIVCRRKLFDAVGGFPLKYVGEDAGIGEAFYRAFAKLAVAPFRVDLLRPSPFVTKALARNPKFMDMPRPASLPVKRYLPAADGTGLAGHPGL
jgi:hypothetical protein